MDDKEALRAFKAAEWPGGGDPRCPACLKHKSAGHAASCWLAKNILDLEKKMEAENANRTPTAK